eukprot:398313_1
MSTAPDFESNNELEIRSVQNVQLEIRETIEKRQLESQQKLQEIADLLQNLQKSDKAYTDGEDKTLRNKQNQFIANLEQKQLIVDLDKQVEDFRRKKDYISAYQAQKTLEEIYSQQDWTKRNAERARKCIVAATGAVNGIKLLIKGNPSGIEIATGVSDIVGGLLQAMPGPYLPLAGSVFSLVGACLGFGLDQGPSITEQIRGMMRELKNYIQKSFEDYKDDDILEHFTTESRKYESAVVFLEALITQQDIRNHINDEMDEKDEKEIDEWNLQSILGKKNICKLSQAELPQLTSVVYREFGLHILGKLEAQIEKYKCSRSDNKKRHVAKYLHYYVKVAIWRRFILSLQCLLLKINGLNITYSAQKKVIELNKEYDKKLLQQFTQPVRFVKHYLQPNQVLKSNQIDLINKYMKQIGVAGQIKTYDRGLVIKHVSSNKYIHVHEELVYVWSTREPRTFIKLYSNRDKASKWRYTNEGYLQYVSSGTNKYIHPWGGKGKNDVKLVLHKDIHDNMKWDILNDGTIRHRKSGKYWHPQGGKAKPSSGTCVVLHDDMKHWEKRLVWEFIE